MITVVWARELIPINPPAPSVFLAGPTPEAGGPVPSWRPAAIDMLRAATTGPLTVLTPESRGGVRAESYDHQFQWETAARASADVVLFWIPRDLEHMPGMTTNVEFGHDIGTGRVVLGCPPDCPNPERNRYLIALARHYGAPVCETLADTVRTALTRIA